MCVDRSSKSATDPATQGERAIQKFGELEIQTGSKMISQFESSYPKGFALCRRPLQ